MRSDQAQNILNRANEKNQASIDQGLNNSGQTVQRITLDLSTARDINAPYQINFAFKSILVEGATSPDAFFFMKPNNRDDVQSPFKMSQRDSWAVEFPIARAYLHWPAQPGRSVDIVLFTNAEFRSGSQLSLTAGGTSISEGATIVGPTAVTLAAATTAVIAPQLLTRKIATIQNKTGADIYIGDSTVTNTGASEGIVVGDGEIIRWRNTAALYAYSVAGGKVSRLEEA